MFFLSVLLSSGTACSDLKFVLSWHLQHRQCLHINHHLSWLFFTCMFVCVCLTGMFSSYYIQHSYLPPSCSLTLPLFFSSRLSPTRLSDSSAEVMEVDHDRQLVFRETLCVSSLTALSPGRVNGGACSSTAAGLGLLGAVQPSDEQVAARLSAPVVTTQLDTRNIAFERSDTLLICTEYVYRDVKFPKSIQKDTMLSTLIYKGHEIVEELAVN